MKKDKLLQELIARAQEQQIVLHDVPFPEFFLFISRKLGEHPWKIFVPLGVLLSIVLHALWGKLFDETVLWIFGGL